MPIETVPSFFHGGEEYKITVDARGLFSIWRKAQERKYLPIKSKDRNKTSLLRFPSVSAAKTYIRSM
jgi:hypothetical protein